MPAVDPKKIVDSHVKFEAAMKRHGVNIKKPLRMFDKICWRDAHESRRWLNILLLFRYPSGESQYFQISRCFHLFSVAQ